MSLDETSRQVNLEYALEIASNGTVRIEKSAAGDIAHIAFSDTRALELAQRFVFALCRIDLKSAEFPAELKPNTTMGVATGVTVKSNPRERKITLSLNLWPEQERPVTNFVAAQEKDVLTISAGLRQLAARLQR